jgi:hypothetical protein
MGTTSFGAVPFALYSASSAKVDDKLNVSDTTTMLKVYAKAMSVQTLETAVASKLTAADTLTMLKPYAKAAYTIDSNFFRTQLATKLSLSDSTTAFVTPSQLAGYNFSSGGTNITNSVSMDTSSLSNRINLKIDASKVGLANGVASLNASGLIPSSQLPPVSISSTSVVSNDVDMLALSSATVGSIAIRTDLNKNFVLSALPASTLGNWVELLTPAAPVQTVNGYTGTVNLSKIDIDLNNVDNTSDITKPISNPTQAALDLKLDANKVGAANGVASLNTLGKIPSDQIPAISFSSVKVLASEAEMLALSSAVVGSVVIRTDINKNYVLAVANPAVLSNWIQLLTPAPPVQTVNGYSGNVSLTKSDLGLTNIDNTSDANKPISIATQAALDEKPTRNFITTAVLIGNATNTSDILTLKSAVVSNTLSITSTTAALVLKAPLYKTIRNAESVSGIASSKILTDANSGHIIYSQWAQKPVFPESLSDGFQCTIVNYSNGAITSNTLTTAKFFTNSSGNAGVSNFTIAAGGSAIIYAIKIDGQQRYYVSSGDQASSATIADGSIANAKLAGSISATKLIGTDIKIGRAHV